MTIDEEIAQYDKKIQELKEKKKYFESLSETQKLAEELHKNICHYNHCSECDWEYCKWNEPGYSKTIYRKMAAEILRLIGFDTAMKIAKKLNKSVYTSK